MIDDPTGRYQSGPIRTPAGIARDPGPPPLILVPRADLAALIDAASGGPWPPPPGVVERLRAVLDATAEAERRYNMEP